MDKYSECGNPEMHQRNANDAMSLDYHAIFVANGDLLNDVMGDDKICCKFPISYVQLGLYSINA